MCGSNGNGLFRLRRCGLRSSRPCDSRAFGGLRRCDAIRIFILIASAAKECLQQRLALAAAGRSRARTGAGSNLDGGRADALLVIRQSLLVTGKRLAVGRKMQRIAVREDADEFLAAHARPGANAADIHVHEGRTRTRIETHAADLHLHADFAQTRQLHAGYVKIHGLAKHMLAFFRDTLGARAQETVGLRRAEGRNDVDVIGRAAAAINFPDEIEQARIHPCRLVAAPVTQESIQLLQTLLVVFAIALEGDDRLLACMDIIQFKAARLGEGFRRRGTYERHGGEHQAGKGDSACRQLRAYILDQAARDLGRQRVIPMQIWQFDPRLEDNFCHIASNERQIR